MKKLLALAIVASTLCACSDAARAHYKALGRPARVELWSGDQLIREWTSTGAVQNEGGSDGYFFNDSATGCLVRITGTIVITPKD